MKLNRVLAASLVALMAISSAGYAAEGDKPMPKNDTKDLKGVRLIKPYSDLKDLTPEQTTKLKEIHKKFSEQIKALEAQQREEMATVLTDVQKKEVAEAQGNAKMERKGGKPATPPASGEGKDTAK